jgi:hypothetical protein
MCHTWHHSNNILAMGLSRLREQHNIMSRMECCGDMETIPEWGRLIYL